MYPSSKPGSDHCLTWTPRVGPALLVAGILACVAGAAPVRAADGTTPAVAGPRIVDPNTNFHRLYVVGAGLGEEAQEEEDSWNEDLGEVKAAWEEKDENGNYVRQGAGSTSVTLEQPTAEELQTAIDNLKATAQAGDAVTIYYSGHGYGGEDYGQPDIFDESFDEYIVLKVTGDPADADNRGEVKLTDDEFADMITGGMFGRSFGDGVNVAILFDSCYCGGMADGRDDLHASDNLAVIGATTQVPTDPSALFGLKGATRDTLSEDFAKGAGGAADANEDGIVTTAELTTWLQAFGQGWSLGAVPEPALENPRPRKVTVDGYEVVKDEAGNFFILLTEEDSFNVYRVPYDPNGPTPTIEGLREQGRLPEPEVAGEEPADNRTSLSTDVEKALRELESQQSITNYAGPGGNLRPELRHGAEQQLQQQEGAASVPQQAPAADPQVQAPHPNLNLQIQGLPHN